MRMGGSYSKNTNSPVSFKERFLKTTFGVRAAVYMTLFRLAGGEETGWCFTNFNHQTSGSNQSGVCFTVSMESASCSWVRVLVPAEELKDMYWIVVYFPWGRAQTLFLPLNYSFLTVFFLYCPTSLISNCLNLPLGAQGRARRLKPFSTNRKQGTQEGFCTWEGPAEFTQFQPPAFFDTPQVKVLRGTGQDEKEHKVLGKEVNHKLSRGTEFQRDSVLFFKSGCRKGLMSRPISHSWLG